MYIYAHVFVICVLDSNVKTVAIHNPRLLLCNIASQSDAQRRESFPGFAFASTHYSTILNMDRAKNRTWDAYLIWGS